LIRSNVASVTRLLISPILLTVGASEAVRGRISLAEPYWLSSLSFDSISVRNSAICVFRNSEAFSEDEYLLRTIMSM
jgi:hypothetical protein